MIEMQKFWQGILFWRDILVFSEGLKSSPKKKEKKKIQIVTTAIFHKSGYLHWHSEQNTLQKNK